MKFGDLHFFDLLTFYRIVAISPYESYSLNADLIWEFDDRNPSHYDLFNVKYVVAPSDLPMPMFLRPIKETSRYILYRAETSGYAQFAALMATKNMGSQSSLLSQNKSWLSSADASVGRFIRYEYPAGRDGVASSSSGGAPGTAERPGCLRGGMVAEDRVWPGRIDLRVQCQEAATLVLKVTYHLNWRVSLDGQKVRPFMVSPSFIGLDVPAGAHQIRAEYRSPTYRTALLLLGACTLLATVWFRRRFARLDALASSGR